MDRIPETVAALRARTDARIVIFGPTVEYDTVLPTLYEEFGSLDGFKEFARQHDVASRRTLNKNLAKVARAAGAFYVDKYAIICGPSRTDCPAIVPGTNSLWTFDNAHWTLQAAKWFGRCLENQHTEVSEMIFGQ